MWIVLALAAALFQALRGMGLKHLGHRLDEYMSAWGRFTFMLPFTLVMGATMVWIPRGVPDVGDEFVLACLGFGVFQSLSTIALCKALKHGAISSVTALGKMSLIFLVVIGYVTLHERPSWLGLCGMGLSVTGAYMFNIRRARQSGLAPLLALFEDRSLRWALISALFYAPSVLTIKRAAVLSDPYTGSAGAYLAASILFTPIVVTTSRRHFRSVWANGWAFAALGAFAALTTICQVVAYTMTLSSYVEAVKQVEIVFAMMVGRIVFREGARSWEFSLGAVLMLAGTILLSLVELK